MTQRPTLREPYPTELKPYKPGLAERLYLPLIGGLITEAISWRASWRPQRLSHRCVPAVAARLDASHRTWLVGARPSRASARVARRHDRRTPKLPAARAWTPIRAAGHLDGIAEALPVAGHSAAPKTRTAAKARWMSTGPCCSCSSNRRSLRDRPPAMSGPSSR